MKKTFVIDTNVIRHTHGAIFSFQKHDVVVPLGVIEELDRFKGVNDERGREARQLQETLTIFVLSVILQKGLNSLLAVHCRL